MSNQSVELTPVTPGSLQDKMDTDHPTIYADQIMSIAFGPFVSRFTFGVENHGTQTRTPVATVVMPTNMFHNVALELSKQLSTPEFKAHAAGQYQAYLGPEAFEK